MKVLFLCTFYHTARLFRDTMDHLEQQGHTVKAFNAVARGARIAPQCRDIMDDAVDHVECFTRWDRYVYPLKQSKIRRVLLAHVDVAEYDLIHSHSLFNGGYVAYSLSRELGIPYVVSVRNTDLNVFLRIPVFRAVGRRIARGAAGLVFLSESYRERYLAQHAPREERDALRSKSTTIWNGIDDFWLANRGNARHLSDQGSLRLLAIGSIDRNKNHLTTAKAVSLLASRGYQATLTVVGPVADRAVAKHLESMPFVRMVGYLPKEDLLPVFRAHDVFVMPSRHETFGRVYAEAMTQGLPVVCSRGEGFDGLFPDGSAGYAVPSMSAASVADAIIKIAADYSSMSRRCVEMCHVFDWSSLSLRLADFYEKAVRRPTRD